MKIIVVAIRDRAVDAFQQPFYVPALGAAIRAFMDALAGDNTLSKHPEDYDLYHLGDFDDNKGVFNMLPEGPKKIADGKPHAAKLVPTGNLTMRIE